MKTHFGHILTDIHNTEKLVEVWQSGNQCGPSARIEARHLRLTSGAASL